MLDCSCFSPHSLNNFYRQAHKHCFSVCTSLQSCMVGGHVPECTGALKDNKDFLVGRTGLDSSTTRSAIFYSYLLKIWYFCLWVNVSITGFAAVQWYCACLTNTGGNEAWLHITVQFYRHNTRLSTSPFPWVVKTNTLKSFDRKNWDWSSYSEPCSNVQNV